MNFVKMYGAYKKCMCCGRVYPVDTKQTHCDCEAKGYLYVVNQYYQPRVVKNREEAHDEYR